MPEAKTVSEVVKIYAVRCCLSFLTPAFVYSLGYCSLWLLASPVGQFSAYLQAPFFNRKAIGLISAFTFLWSFQQISMSFIFEPIFRGIRWKLRQNVEMSKVKKDKDGNPLPVVPFFMHGNFAPVKDEVSYKVVKILEGKVPTDLNGTFLRNGPNIKTDDSDTMQSHWFAGDGMLHAVCLNHGQVLYSNTYVKTDKFLKEKEAGKKLGRQIQDMVGIGVMLAPLHQACVYLGYINDGLEKGKSGTANTALITHAKRTYALVESDFPYQVKIEPKEDEVAIKSVGFENFEGKLEHPCSAHPKVDRHTNELFVFSYDVKNPVCHLSAFNGKRQLITSVTVPTLSPRMIHEFLITEKYAIVPDLPMEFDPKGAVKEKRFIFHYNEKAPARYGIWPRNSKSGTDIKWFEVKPHHAFHFGGCWDELNEKGDSVVTLYAVVHEGIQIGFQAEHPLDKNNQQKLEKYVFNMTDLSVKKTTLLEGMYMEFPILNPHYYGHKSRYLYFPCRLLANDHVPQTEAEQQNEGLTGFIKFDQQTDKVIGKVSFGETYTGGEVYYQQRDGSDPLKDEDDGYLMTTIHDWKTNKSEFALWDAKTLKVAFKAELDTRVPNGFHGTFVQENDY